MTSMGLSDTALNEAERVARRFHEVYELLAPEHDYETRTASAVPWDEVREPNRSLMIHVAGFLLREHSIAVGDSLPKSWS